VTSDTLPPLALHLELDRRVNFAMQQNHVPVVKGLHIENAAAVSLRDLRLRISAEPEFADEWSRQIALVPEGAIYEVAAVDLALSPRYLGALTERVRGELHFELLRGEQVLLERAEPVDLLAWDEWSGLSSLPELLVAFVLPDHPAVDRILRSAAEILMDWTQDSSLQGYQCRDPRRIYTTAGAIYTALQQLGLSCVDLPASFESEGQRICLPDRILESRTGTCLDLTLLVAACLERAGLHPLVVFVKGHSFVGTWLQEECFGEPAIDEPLRLRKRVDLDEIAVFDPTSATARPTPDFDRAAAEAKRRLTQPEDFLCVIDVKRARDSQIRSLPERAGRAKEAVETEKQTVSSGPIPAAPDVSGLSVTSAAPLAPKMEAVSETPATRLDRWRRRLLDLSLRNRLLNFRETKKTIPLLCSNLSALEDALAEGATLQVFPRPPGLPESDASDSEARQRTVGDDSVEALLRAELGAKRLHADLASEELDRRLLGIYRAARLGLEEGGSSALYLAIGFLAWYEEPQSEKQRLAPILLLPLELHRRSVREGFTLRLSDDEARVNETLLEMLRQDYELAVAGQDSLPEDESGLDVPRILRTFREAIRDIDRWDVLEIARIGLFSFTKFLMWRDLTERADDLMRNPVVEHLVIRPEQEFDPDASFPEPGRLDEERSPVRTFCPLSADSSQLSAVLAAAEGRSFVLEGPPGTGKSQTIANLVAHCLAEGMTVLFVSEKMAALSVVYNRLQKVGLGRHCLELHSNKTQKREVIAQLKGSLRQIEVRSPQEWERVARLLEGLRGDLNGYVHALHRKRSTGETVFQATSRLIGMRDVPRVGLGWDSPDALDAEQLASLRDLVARLSTAGAAVREVRGHPWEAAQCADWRAGWEEKVRGTIGEVQGAVGKIEPRAREVSERLSLGELDWSLDELALLDELAGLLLGAPAAPPAILVLPGWDEIEGKVTSWIAHGRRRDALRTDLFGRYGEKILALDIDELVLCEERAEASRWPLSWLRRRPARKALEAVAKSGKAPAKSELKNDLEKARTLRDDNRALALVDDEARALLGLYWQDNGVDWDDLEGLRDWARHFRSLASRVAGDDLGRAAALRETWAHLVTEGRELLGPDGAIGHHLLAYRDGYQDFLQRRAVLDGMLELDRTRAWGLPEAADALGSARRSLRGFTEHASQLREWCAWRRTREEAVHANLAPLVEAYEEGEFSSRELPSIFERSYTTWWYTSVTDTEPELSQFFSPEHERKIQRFCEVDEEYTELTSGLIAARLSERIPASSESVLANSEMGFLMREIAKKRRHVSVRRLLQTIPNLLPRLKPCLLMSPMSVAQYLDTSYQPFDLVVFDEASQIPVWDAVGAIARAKQAVIVGDPKQLPPTVFFQRAEGAEEELASVEMVEDLESILDECIGARIPCRSLDWHYRSRHESLIAFSNSHYYDGRLVTFPSPHREGMGVSWYFVPEGVYDRGKSATNRVEAEAVVAEITRRLRSSNLSRYSIGVVTFSRTQQMLIEDLLEEARRDDAEIDAFFAEETAEPVFVKNLENVQGDERDVILFSICYGPDPQGRVSMNFGPMNWEGGERRLNVAITRARREVLVFSSVRAEQIDLTRTRARGVRDLKGFLEYAERGSAAIATGTEGALEAESESPFERAVHDALADRGWKSHQQAGGSGHRIDLAVVDSEAPAHYLLGIECDGASYHRAKTARDRDCLREAVLRGLGWEIHRIWSADWWTNPEHELEKVEAALELARQRRPAEVEGRRDAVNGGGSVSPSAAEQPAEADTEAVDAPGKLQEAERPPVYVPAPIRRDLGTPEEFYDERSDRLLWRTISDVVAREGPISLNLCARRITAAWGFERLRSQAVERIRLLLPTDRVRLQRSDAGEFLWPVEQAPETYAVFRVPGENRESMRQAKDLPVEEISNAALYLLRQHISAPEDEFAREVGRLFGFQRAGHFILERMRMGIQRLVDKQSAERRGEMIVLNDW